MKTFLRSALVLLMFSLLVISCAPPANKQRQTLEPQAMVVGNIGRIFMHKYGEYTFLVNKPDGTIGRLRIEITDETKLQMKADLEPSEPIKVEFKCYSRGNEQGKTCRPIPEHFSYWNVQAQNLLIHVHSAKDIEGGGWERMQGKQRIQEHTTVIQ